MWGRILLLLLSPVGLGPTIRTSVCTQTSDTQVSLMNCIKKISVDRKRWLFLPLTEGLHYVSFLEDGDFLRRGGRGSTNLDESLPPSGLLFSTLKFTGTVPRSLG